MHRHDARWLSRAAMRASLTTRRRCSAASGPRWQEYLLEGHLSLQKQVYARQTTPVAPWPTRETSLYLRAMMVLTSQ
ncbi:hypothetical protein GCM10018952_28800 [Streptosporangium vulgare]